MKSYKIHIEKDMLIKVPKITPFELAKGTNIPKRNTPNSTNSKITQLTVVSIAWPNNCEQQMRIPITMPIMICFRNEMLFILERERDRKLEREREREKIITL